MPARATDPHIMTTTRSTKTASSAIVSAPARCCQHGTCRPRPKMLPAPGCLSAQPVRLARRRRASIPGSRLPNLGLIRRRPTWTDQVNGPGRPVDGAARSEAGGWSRSQESRILRRRRHIQSYVPPRGVPSLRLRRRRVLAIAKEPGTQSWLGRIFAEDAASSAALSARAVS